MNENTRRRVIALVIVLALTLAACESTNEHTTPPAPSGSAGAPTLVIEPDPLTPNAAARAYGAGFPAGALVEITLDAPAAGYSVEPFGQGEVNEAGEVVVDFQMPTRWVSGALITGPDVTVVMATEDGDYSATDEVGVVVAEGLSGNLVLRPALAAPGQEVFVNGAGFEPGAELGIRLGLPETLEFTDDLATTTVDSLGRFDETITVPADWPASDELLSGPALILAAVDLETGEVAGTASLTLELSQAAPEGMDTPAP